MIDPEHDLSIKRQAAALGIIRGSWRDNVFVERVWKFVMYEEIYLHAYNSVSEAHAGIGRYIRFYNSNSIRHHSSLNKLSPDQVYFNRLPETLAA